MANEVILDMDPGVDDALALVLALRSEELEVSAVTTVFGNVDLERTTVNALKVLKLLGAEVPVAKGMAGPLKGRRVDAQHIHGEDGLGGAVLPLGRRRVERVHAVDFIVDRVMSSGRGKLTLIATAPLTNIASALLREPGVARRVGRLVCMGGAFGLTPFGFGNQTSVAEFNVYADPEAARVVYSSGMKVVAVGLDVTMDPAACLGEKEYLEMERASTGVARFAVEATRWLRGRFGCVALHDPLAVAVAVDPSLVRTGEFFVDVETGGGLGRGRTVVVPRRGGNVEVCVGVEGGRFLGLFMDRVVRFGG